MIVSKPLATFLLGTIVSLTLLTSRSIAMLSATQIGELAKQFTVKIDGQEPGSGTLISRKENVYRVLTNWHVVDSEGKYTVQTQDGMTYPVTQKVRLTGADLAILSFTSPKSYVVAIQGNSDSLAEGQIVHFAGYPSPQQVAQHRRYRFYSSQNIVGFLSSNDIKEGYQIIFTGAALPGMSGSPILDNNGALIGIYGRSETNLNTAQISLYGIPLNTAIGLARRAGIDISNASPRSVPNPPNNRPTPPPRTFPPDDPSKYQSAAIVDQTGQLIPRQILDKLRQIFSAYGLKEAPCETTPENEKVIIEINNQYLICGYPTPQHPAGNYPYPHRITF